MPKSTESLNRSLFDLLRTKGYNPTIMDTSGKEIPVPEEAEVFQFDFIKDDMNYGKVTISIDGLQKLTIYFNDDVANSDKGTDSESRGSDWYSLLKQLKKFATHRQLSFDLKNSSHLKHDMAKREYMKNKEKISEGYYPMGKKASYSDAIPSVKIVIEHTRQLEEGEARFRSINRIFLENQQGERFLLNTKKPGVARVYARHIAEGGRINDQRWDHIGNLVEEYSKMSGFVRATKNGQFNESAQQLVNEGLQHYQKLRETLSRMTGHRGYNTYFESWAPSLMEDEADTSNINELFMQETLDPRIESVMPILSKLHKQVHEMKEISELSEWADSLLEGGDGGEASEEPTQNMTDDSEDLEEGLGDVAKKVGGTIKKVAGKAMDVIAPGDEELLKQLQKSAGVRGASHGKPSMAHSEVEKRVDEEEVEESGLQAYLGNKKYGEKGMDALRKAGREHASKEKMAQIRAKYDKLDEEDQLDEINWKKAAATGALALGALGGLGASGSAQARVSPGADGQMSPSAAQQMAQQGFQASAEKSGGQAANQNLDKAEKVERGDNGIVVHYDGKEYKGMLVPKDGPTPRGAKMIKINQGQMGERGIGNYTTYLLPNGTAYIYKLASQSANEGVAEGQINEAYIYTTADAVNVLANLRKISKNIEIGNPYKGNLANEYVNDVWSVYTWLENTDANMYDPKLKPILADVFELRKKAKALETQPNSGQNTQLANQIVNTLYPLMQWIEMNVKSGRQGVAEESSENKYANLSNRGVNRGINRAGDDFNRMLDLDQVESPHYKTQHQQDTKQRLKTKPMAGPKGVLPEQGVAEGSGFIDQMASAGHKIIANKKTPKGSYTILQNKNDGKYEIHKLIPGGIGMNEFEFVSAHKTPEEIQAAFRQLTGVEEGLDANQKRVGQLGPTEKVKNNNIGKLVGANENFINMAPQAVAEGQEDLDAILRIIRK